MYLNLGPSAQQSGLLTTTSLGRLYIVIITKTVFSQKSSIILSVTRVSFDINYRGCVERALFTPAAADPAVICPGRC